jgi:hypothetical protein
LCVFFAPLHREELCFDGAGVHTVLAEKELYDGSSGISHRAIVGDLATSSALISFLWIYPVSLYSSIDQSLPASHGVEKKNSWGSNPFRNDDSMNPLASGRCVTVRSEGESVHRSSEGR